jgi:hypothetical protein
MEIRDKERGGKVTGEEEKKRGSERNRNEGSKSKETGEKETGG